MSERGRTGRGADRHSDLGPSSKDWQPGSAGRDEDFTPEKDLWTAAHKGDLGAGRPGEDVHLGGMSGARSGGGALGGDEVQPGTHTEGHSWQSRRPDPDDADAKLDQALQDSFPTSDPPSPASAGVTGWDLGDSEQNRTARRGASNRRRGVLRTGSAAPAWAVAALVLLPALAWVAYSLRHSWQSPSPPQQPRFDPRQDEWSAYRHSSHRPVI